MLGMRVTAAPTALRHSSAPRLVAAAIPVRGRASVRLSASADPAAATPATSTSPYSNGVSASTTDGTPAVPGQPSTSTINENFKGDMLKPSVFNTPLVRALAVLGSTALVASSTAFLPARLGAFLHVTSYAILLGTQLWNTFFVGITMFKNLPRQTFGRVQSKLFPQYFALTTGANLLALGSLALAGAAATDPGTRALVGLGVALAASLGNWLVVEPVTTRLMFERYDLENLAVKSDNDKARIAELYKQFGKWHGISSVINLVQFCVVVAHGWYLASLLVV